MELWVVRERVRTRAKRLHIGLDHYTRGQLVYNGSTNEVGLQ
jgi:hypothetical protein